MDLAHGGFWPSGEDSVLAHGGRPSEEGELAVRGFLAPSGGTGMDLAHEGFWPSWEDSVLALGGWPSGGPLPI